MNYVNFNNFQPSSANTFSKEDARVAILMVETKNSKAAEKMVANLDETNNQLKDIVALVENKLAILDALKMAKANNELKALNEAYESAKAENLESFEFKGQTFKVINESVETQVEEKFKYTEDDINTLYGFYGTLETNFKKKDVERMYTEGVEGLMKAYKISEKVAIAILDSKVGRHMADMIYSKIATDAVDALAKYFGSGARVWNYIASMIRLEESLMTDSEAKLNEDETLIFDELGTDLTKLQDQIITMLGWDIKDQKWINGLKAIQKDLDKVENTIAKFDDKLGAIEYNESKVNEAGDHEVGMANGQLADIVKNAQELMSKIGTTEKDIPGWIQDHISQSQNYINQANSNYHELEESAEVNEMKKPKTWDSQFAMKAIDAYEAGEFDPENDKSLADWEKEYNGGKKPNPGFDTYNIIAYALMTGKKPDGTPVKESVEVNEARFTKDKLLKLIAKLDDAEITVKGKTYIIYNPDSNNDDNAAMWGKDTIKALNSDGDEFEFKYSDIEDFDGSIKYESELVGEAWIGPFQFNDKMSDEELKKMYDDAVSGYANWQKGLQHPKSDYKKAYQEIEKILKKRGVKIDESIEEALKSETPNEVITVEVDMAWDPADEKEAKAAFKKYKIKVDGTGEPGTYEVTGKKKDILAYLQSEFYEMDDETIEEYYPELLESYGNEMGLTKVQTKRVAETLAKAISKNDGVNCTVNAKTLEEDSFDLDIDGELGAAGSYNIYDDGSVVNHAVTPNEIYGNYKSTVEEFIRGLRKPIYESIIANEAKEIEVSLRYARLANDVFDDMYRRLGKKTSTNTFKMNSDDLADDFTQSLLDAGIPQEEIY